MNYIGVDPGKKGGLAVIRDDGTVEAVAFSEAEYYRIASSLDGNARAVVEDVHAMPKQGTASMFSFGYNKGFICGMLYALKISVQLVSPNRWKRHFSLDSDKSRSIACAQRLFPSVSLYASSRCRVPHDGIAEALIMAEYCRRICNIGNDIRNTYPMQ